jgi:hypothetical protein
LIGQRRADEDVLTAVVGHERFAAAARLMLTGVFASGQRDANRRSGGLDGTMAEDVRLASLPFARLRIEAGTIPDDVTLLVAWWCTLISTQRGATQ